jgi:DNA-binding CsgD family transcriptional regulator
MSTQQPGGTGGTAGIDELDLLVAELYRIATESNIADFRTQALTRLQRALALDNVAWWWRGVRGGAGELSQGPRAFVALEELQAAVAGVPPQTPIAQTDARLGGWLFQMQHLNGRLVSTILLRFPQGARLPDNAALRRLCVHLVEAAGIALAFDIRRDEWLDAMGRSSRGSAALVDADGTIYSASPRFLDLLGNAGRRTDALPFPLPDVVLTGAERSFRRGDFHCRVSRTGQLYLLHARKPMPLDALSPREQEIARALGNGKTFKSVARQYGIAVSTVANHASRIYRKLAIYRREELIALLRTPQGQGSPAVMEPAVRIKQRA